ncbi:MAG: radical SAM protein [Methanosarcinales archaeon]|nr:radical SAM protein [Methanosarcinales archaeon]
MEFTPAYTELVNTGEIDERIESLFDILTHCDLCPRECKINRLRGKTGYCKADANMMVSMIQPHFWEETPLVGLGGSGTVFLSNCNLQCVYCQNYETSHNGVGLPMTCEQLADNMLYLQRIGCHNINLVTPTHYIPQLVKSIAIAARKGLRLPIVYNCGGYESVKTLKLLDGIIDIYMPDFKYGNDESARLYSNAPDYFEVCSKAVREMHKQVGDLVIEKDIAYRGLLIRHLILPDDRAGSFKVLEFIANEISKDSYVNIMFQYRPLYHAKEFDEINRTPYIEERDSILDMAIGLGLHLGFPSG